MTTLRDVVARAEFSVARLMFRLPPKTKRLLCGKPPIVIDGQTLELDLQLLLVARAWRKVESLSSGTPAEARRRLRKETLRYAGPPLAVGAVRDLEIPGPARPLRARHYAPPFANPRPLLMFLHGGGFVTGDLDTHDAPCRLLCREAGIHVVSIDYRLAPEHPFPAAVDDAYAAFCWVRASAAELGADASRIGVGGDSAGGNLAAVVARLAANDAMPPPAAQLLIYPTIEPHNDDAERASMKLFADGFLLTRADARWYSSNYLGPTMKHHRDPRVALLQAPNLAGLCPALVVTAGFDPLRDEGEDYAAALRAAGVAVELRRLDGFVHGFVNMIGVSPVARAALSDVAHALARLLAPIDSPA